MIEAKALSLEAFDVLSHGVERPPDRGRERTPRRIGASVAGGLGLLLALVAPAGATLATPPHLDPDHGPPGTLVLVDGFPEATVCPTVRMSIAPEGGITAPGDPRLRDLAGSVGYGLGSGQASTGPDVRVPLYSFLVPNLPPGTYVTYFSCPGSRGWEGPFEVGPFRVEPSPAGRTPEPLVLVTPARPADCPRLPLDAATLIRLGDAKAFACYGRATLSFDSFVPRTEGLGGVSAPVWPRWLDPWAGGLLQATDEVSGGDYPGYGQGPFLGVAVPPALGICGSLDVDDPACPFAPYLDGWVRVSGHYDDPVALTCRIAGTSYRNPPSRSDAVSACRARFVLSALGPATGLGPAALPATSTTPGTADWGSDGNAAPVIVIPGLVAFAFGWRRLTCPRRHT